MTRKPIRRRIPPSNKVCRKEFLLSDTVCLNFRFCVFVILFYFSSSFILATVLLFLQNAF